MNEPIVAAMSGGVDSSVTAALLVESGHAVTGLFMKSGAEEAGLPAEASAKAGGCCSASDAYDAARVAAKLGIPFYSVDFAGAFETIVGYFVDEYRAGRTPNPCVMCNRRLKFGTLVERAAAVGASCVATGHYARRVDLGERVGLARGVDRDKDQSYVLFPLTQEQLRRARFPVGEMTKPQVRAKARELGLAVADKRDSYEICFVPGDDYRRVLAARAPEALRPGEFVDREGRVLGTHDGYGAYTIGQRKGLGIALGRPAYVTAIDPAANRVVLGTEADLDRSTLVARDVNWVSIAAPSPGTELEADIQIRAHHEAAPGRIRVLPDGAVEARFSSPQRAITPGQAAVFYRDDFVLGGGWIE